MLGHSRCRALIRRTDPNFQTATSFHSRGRYLPRHQTFPFDLLPKEGAERRKGAIVLRRAPATEHVPVFAKTSSPYGAPPRCFVTVGPLYVAGPPWLLPHGLVPTTRTEASIRGSLVSREAFSTRLPGAWFARPMHAGSPLPIHAQSLCRAPLSEWGYVRHIGWDRSASSDIKNYFADVPRPARAASARHSLQGQCIRNDCLQASRSRRSTIVFRKGLSQWMPAPHVG